MVCVAHNILEVSKLEGTFIHIYMYDYVCICVYVYIYMCICSYEPTYTYVDNGGHLGK